MIRKPIAQLGLMLLLCVLTGVITTVVLKRDTKKIAVVDAIRLFNEYAMKVELEKVEGLRLQSILNRRDSLEQVLQQMQTTVSTGNAAYQHLLEAYEAQRQYFDQEYAAGNQQVYEQVWKRLNPVIDAYGKQKNLRLIVGANGMGSVLYFDDYHDHTQALIDFANNAYETGN